MTITGAGGVVIQAFTFSKRFCRDLKKLDPQMQKRVQDRLDELKQQPIPAGLRFEKLKGHSNPDVYSIHITGNYKLTMSIDGTTAALRRVSNHDDIDRAP